MWEKLLDFIIRNNLYTIPELINLILGLNLDPKLLNISEIDYLINVFTKLEALLNCSEKIYDQTFYKKKIISKKFQKNYHIYQNLKIAHINYCVDDLGENTNKFIDYLDEINLPIEFLILTRIYLCNTSINFKIYPGNFLLGILNNYSTRIRKSFHEANTKIQNKEIYLIPLCYKKHYGEYFGDKKFIQILCFAYLPNYSGTDLENRFRSKSERFFMVEFTPQDLKKDRIEVQEYLEKIHLSIICNNISHKITEYYYPENINDQCKSLFHLIELFYK